MVRGGAGWTIPYIKTYISGNEWIIAADYPLFNTIGQNANGTWKIKILITPKKLVRNLGTQTIDLSNSSTGAAPSPIID